MSSNTENRSLVATSEAKHLIAKAVADGDVAVLDELRKQADAFQLYHRRSGAKDVADDAGEIKVRAEAGLGAIDTAENPHGGDRTEQDAGTPILNIDRHTRANWRKLGQLAPEVLDERIERAREDEDYGVSTVRVLKSAHVAHNTGENEWYTPVEIIEAAVLTMGGIDLDPASTPEANRIVQATKFYTKADDGLAQQWVADQLWMNPPYAQPWVDRFSSKLVDDYKSDNVTQACVLVNNASDTAWFTRLSLVASARCDAVGRVRFWHPDRVSAPLQGQVIWYFGANALGFVEAFARIGVSGLWAGRYIS